MLLRRFEYIARIFLIEEDFLKAQKFFAELLFYGSYRRDCWVFVYYQPAEKCEVYDSSRNGHKTLVTPHKEFSKEGLRDFLSTCGKVAYAGGVIGPDFIEQVVDDIVRTKNNGHSTEEVIAR